MTYVVPLFSTLNLLGVDLSTAGYDQPYTATATNPSTPEYPSAPFAIGTEIINSSIGRAVYATANTAINQGNCCVLTKAFSAIPITSAIAATSLNLQLGVAMSTAMTTGQYGWFMTEGILPSGVTVTASIAQNVTLYTTATAGVLGAIATGSSYTISGISTTTTSAATAGAYACTITNIAIGAAN